MLLYVGVNLICVTKIWNIWSEFWVCLRRLIDSQQQCKHSTRKYPGSMMELSVQTTVYLAQYSVRRIRDWAVPQTHRIKALNWSCQTVAVLSTIKEKIISWSTVVGKIKNNVFTCPECVAPSIVVIYISKYMQAQVMPRYLETCLLQCIKQDISWRCMWGTEGEWESELRDTHLEIEIQTHLRQIVVIRFRAKRLNHFSCGS